MSTAAPRHVPRHILSSAFVPATAMQLSYLAGQTTVRTQLPAAARTMTSAATARDIARSRTAAGTPPKLMVITCAEWSTAYSMASATATCETSMTLVTARIGMRLAAGADPATVRLSGDTTTLAVPVP